MNAPPTVSLAPSRESAIRRGLVGPPHETLESITRRSRFNSVVLAIGCLPLFHSSVVSVAFNSWLLANPIRRAPDIVDRGLDRDMQRSHSREAEPKRGHTRTASGDDHKRMVKL